MLLLLRLMLLLLMRVVQALQGGLCESLFAIEDRKIDMNLPRGVAGTLQVARERMMPKTLCVSRVRTVSFSKATRLSRSP